MAVARKSRSSKASASAAVKPEPKEAEEVGRGRKSRSSTREGKRAQTDDDEVGDGEVVFQGGAAGWREGREEGAGGGASAGKRARNSSSNPGGKGGKKARCVYIYIYILNCILIACLHAPPHTQWRFITRLTHRLTTECATCRLSDASEEDNPANASTSTIRTVINAGSPAKSTGDRPAGFLSPGLSFWSPKP